MQWQFTRTRADLEAGLMAEALTPGTTARGQFRRTAVRTAAVFVALIIFLTLTMAPQMGAFWWLMPAFTLLCFVVTAVLLLTPRGFARLQIRAFGAEHDVSALLTACTVTLDEDAFWATGGDLVTGTSEWRCPLFVLDRAVNIAGGVLVVCQDGRAFFMPPTAFDGAHTAQDCAAAVDAAIGRAKNARLASVLPDAAPRAAGYTATADGAVLNFTLEEPEAKQLYRQMVGAAYRQPAIYLRSWQLWLVFALILGYEVYLFWPLAVVTAGIVAGTVVWGAWHPKQLQGMLGGQTLTLSADGIETVRDNGRWQYPWSAFDMVLETKDGLFPYSVRGGAVLFVPKAAFAQAEQCAAFAALLRQHIGKK